MNRQLIHNRVILLVMTMLFACSMTMMAKNKIVRRGMTKEQVTEAIGKPATVSFDQDGETWLYYKNPILNYSKEIRVIFDRNERVVSYQEQIYSAPTTEEPVNPAPMPQPLPPGYPPYPYPDAMPYSLSEADFAHLYGKVQKASFDDNKFDLLEVATIGCYYTCAQSARLIKIFSFDDGRLRALRIMAPHIVDPQNAIRITELFTFSDAKDRALRMLQGQ